MNLVRFSALSPDQRDAVRDIYHEAFPAWQRVEFEALVEADTDPTRLQLVMLDRAAPVAFAALSRFDSVPWWFLEYIAVVRGRRGNGLGGRLWDAIVDRLRKDGATRVVMEVEPPEEAPPGSAERHERERRIEFYRRRGAVQLDVPVYRVPHLSPDDGRSPLMLLAAAIEALPPPSHEEVRKLVRALYVEGYQLPEDDPLLDEALASIGQR